MHFIGIDIGTTSICGIIYNVSAGTVEQSAVRPNDSFLPSRHEWERVQDPRRIAYIVSDILLELRSFSGEILGMGLTGQMHGILYVDKKGKCISPLFTWQDARAGLLYKDGKSYSEYLAAVTGMDIFPGYGLATHFYNTINGLVPPAAHKLCTIHDFIAMHLIGKHAPVMDITDAASLGLFNIEKKMFLKDRIKVEGMEPDLLPEIVDSGTQIGAIASIPVYPAIGDNQASFLGSVKNIKNTLLLNIGTGAQASCYCNQYTAAPGLETRPFPHDGFLVVGASLCGGRSYALLENFFKKTLAFLGQKKKSAIFKAINNIPYEPTRANPLAVSTLFQGTRSNPKLRGSIGNIGLDNLTPEHLVAGFLDGMAEEMHYFHEQIKKSGKEIECMAGSGNAIRKNPLLRKILEKRFGRKLHIPVETEEASIGAALLAAFGKGVYRNIQEAGQSVRYEE